MTAALEGESDNSLFEFRKSKIDKHMRGILTNVLGVLLRLDWRPQHIDIWQNPFGEVYTCEATRNNIAPLLKDIINSYNALQYPRAARHYDGKGLEKGVEWCYTLRRVYSWKKSKDSWVASLFAALETLMAGAAWPQARVGNIFADEPIHCLLYGAPLADSLHVLWRCPFVNCIDDHNILKSNKLIPKANSEAADMPCYWLRGLMPKEMGQVPEDKRGLLDKYYCSPF